MSNLANGPMIISLRTDAEFRAWDSAVKEACRTLGMVNDSIQFVQYEDNANAWQVVIHDGTHAHLLLQIGICLNKELAK